MPDIITVTINPAVDVSTSVDRIEPVRKLRCRPERREPGGGGINVARVARRLGADVLAVYTCGGVIGQLLQKLVEQEGVASHALEIAGQTREDFTVFDEGTRDEYRFVLPGPELREPEWRACLEQVEALAGGQKYIVASGSLPAGAPADFYARLASIAATARARFVVDASGPALKAALDAGVYLAKPNLRELQDMMEEPLGDRESQVRACRRLVERGSAKIVALTLGSEGALLVTEDLVWFSDPLPVKVMSSVGAGDSFLGAMVWALSTGRSLEEALRYAVAAGSAALLAPGTQLSSRADMERLSVEVKLRPL